MLACFQPMILDKLLCFSTHNKNEIPMKEKEEEKKKERMRGSRFPTYPPLLL